MKREVLVLVILEIESFPRHACKQELKKQPEEDLCLLRRRRRPRSMSDLIKLMSRAVI